MLNQKLQQKLLQKLSPQQIQLMKLLQIPAIALEQRIKQEIEENPALEDIVDDNYENEQTTDYDEEFEKTDDGNEDFQEKEFNEEKTDYNFTDYLDDDEYPAYKLAVNNSSPDDDRKDIPYSSGISCQEMLLSQLGLVISDKKLNTIGAYIIGNIDDSGYLQRDINALVDDIAFSFNIETDADEVEKVLESIQSFDPAGVGARNLQECLLLQLKRNKQTPSVVNATNILYRTFDEFTKKHYDKISKKLDLSEEQIKEAISEILKLNPKPGNSMSDGNKGSQYILPDFHITNNDGILELTLNSKNAPELRVSRMFTEMLDDYTKKKGKTDNKTKEAVTFLKQKLDGAKWFIDAIKQRQNTLYVTMESIMLQQKEYFLTGDETKLRPMILKDVAEKVNLDISTISRVVNSKYVQTPFGTLLLKSFFSESLSTDSGEEVSTREVKTILQECVDAEEKRKPLTDEELVKILNDKGYNIARRTVAKYREQLNIPVARLRKEL